MNEETLEHIELKRIYFDTEFNTRGEFTFEQVSMLAEQIEEIGLIHPIVVRPVDDKPGYDLSIVCGFMRYRAHELIKKPTIKCLVRRGLTEQEAMLINIWENLERKSYTLLEEARSVKKVFPDALKPGGSSLRHMMKVYKRDTKWIARRLALLNMPEEVQAFAHSGRLSENKLDLLIKLKFPTEQIAAVQTYEDAYEEQDETGKLGMIPKKYRPKTYKNRPNTDAIIRMMAKMLSVGIVGIGPKMGAWFIGEISDSDLIKEIERDVSLLDRLNEIEKSIRKIEDRR
jgi:ParB/RepB/Spo0J family partition protein